MPRRADALLLLLILALAAGAGCGSGDEAPSGTVAKAVREQLRFVDPDATSVVAVDLRYEGPNWRAVKRLAGRGLEKYREELPAGERPDVPEDADGALSQLASLAGLRLEEDVKPALDGHLVVSTLDPKGAGAGGFAPSAELVQSPAFVAVYRTRSGDLRPIARRVFPDGRRPLAGYRDTVLLGDGVALVGRDTLVAAFGGDVSRGAPEGGRALRGALDRARAGRGYPARGLEQAERDAGQSDPLVLATGGLALARELFNTADLRRARAAIPYLRAIRRGSAAIDVEGDRILGTARLITDRERLRDSDLPVAAADELELPETDAVAGGSRDQSRTTTFASRVARTLYADSRFARAVSRAERDLGRSFEEEVLRQFSCPSISVLDPRPGERVPGAQRFAARSCVRDPARMRALLPRLRPHLPAILEGLQGLGDAGLIGLLLVAPDAPLTPGALLADIGVRPLRGGPGRREQLYEISGLRDDRGSAAAQAGPDAIVFGLIGDAFVVASDRALARRAAALETESIDREAGSAIRAPVGRLLAREGDDVSRALARVLGDLTGTISAEPEATVARGELALTDE